MVGLDPLQVQPQQATEIVVAQRGGDLVGQGLGAELDGLVAVDHDLTGHGLGGADGMADGQEGDGHDDDDGHDQDGDTHRVNLSPWGRRAVRAAGRRPPSAAVAGADGRASRVLKFF